MHLITSRLCGVSGRLSKTADCQFTKEPRQPGSAEGPRSSRRASTALRLPGFMVPGPEPTRTATETRRPAAQRRRFRTARSGQGCLFDLSLCSPSPLHTHRQSRWGRVYFSRGGDTPAGWWSALSGGGAAGRWNVN